jgi:hypothetical protein
MDVLNVDNLGPLSKAIGRHLDTYYNKNSNSDPTEDKPGAEGTDHKEIAPIENKD